MKVLQVNCVYNTGSTGKIVHDIHTELKNNGHDSVVCYGRGIKVKEANVYKTCGELYSKFNNLLSRFTGIMYGGCFLSTNKLIAIIRKENPDVVHLHCINGYFVNIYRLVSWLKANKIKTVLTLHAEFMHTANCGFAFECEKWKTGCGNCPRFKKETKALFFDRTARSYKKMQKAFDGFQDNLIVTSVSPWLMERAKQSPILKDKNHTVVLNGLDTSVFYPRDNKKFIKSDRKTVLFVTPSFSLDKNHLKGGYYVIELARRMPHIDFVIVGCRENLEGLPENVINVGRVDVQDTLAQYYSDADVTILTSKCETFSMVLAESLCCGTPVVGFKAGGPESIAILQYCQFVEYGNIGIFEATLKKTINDVKNSLKIAENAIKKYKKEEMTSKYIDIYSA